MNITQARRIVAARSDGMCEVCGRGKATNIQHRKNRSQGGTWRVSNLLHVCGSGTTGCHGYIHAHPLKSYANGWSVRQARDPADMPALLWKHFGRHYVWLRDDGSWEPVDFTAGVNGKDIA
ncbi:HNH endonuclease signature motif containing protein [Amycolatopsis sp. NPDC021455]|uniref:HNH endonuclease n=1 Tax=Amycolatopsis sp. NPDC021455 TaxID=3154901 RepID=UPI003411BDE0